MDETSGERWVLVYAAGQKLPFVRYASNGDAASTARDKRTETRMYDDTYTPTGSANNPVKEIVRLGGMTRGGLLVLHAPTNCLGRVGWSSHNGTPLANIPATPPPSLHYITLRYITFISHPCALLSLAHPSSSSLVSFSAYGAVATGLLSLW